MIGAWKLTLIYIIKNLQTMETTKNLLKKLAQAKLDISNTKISKEGTNDFSHYDYFTPEQVNKIVQKVCFENGLFTKFDLKRNERWVYGVLTVYDIDSEETISFEWATAIPEIKATNVAQQIWGCMTYTERYLKMTAFWITDNSLDFDTTENTKKTVNQKSESKDITKDWPFTNDLPWFNKEELEQLKWNTEWLVWFENTEDLLKAISTKYKISKEMRLKIADVRADAK